MRLSTLIARLAERGAGPVGLHAPPGVDPDPLIASVTSDSRQVPVAALFAALPGAKADGRQFLNQAVAAGALAALMPEGTNAASVPVPTLLAADPRRAFALAAAILAGPPPGHVLAVTGTNGKSSTVTFYRQLRAALGFSAASLGTLGVEGPAGLRLPGSLTTPDPVALHAHMAQLAAAGVSHVALEASSHGLDQRRLDGLVLTAAAYTNLTRDHLDYHGSLEAYAAAKARLFEVLLPDGAAAVLNMDDPVVAALAARVGARLRPIGFGRTAAEIRLIARVPTAAGQRLDLEIFGERLTAQLPVLGAFQAHNALAALGLVLAEGDVTAPAAVAALEALRAPPGRLQVVARRGADGALAVVDYAHTPDALDRALATLIEDRRPAGVAVVFGCGGDRDPGKRLLMGQVAAARAGRVIITDDNPRIEDAARIRAAIAAGAPAAETIGDRAAAIGRAVADLPPGWLLLVAGKGHEQGQIVGTEVRPFDDAAVTIQAAKDAGW